MDRQKPKPRHVLVIEDPRSPEKLRHRLLEGLRSKRSRVDGRSRPASPKRGRKRQRGLARLHRKLTPQEERAQENWRKSKLGKAYRRRARRAGPERQTGKEIRDALAKKRELRDLRRLARRGFQLSEFCAVHDLGLEAPYRCDCKEGKIIG